MATGVGHGKNMQQKVGKQEIFMDTGNFTSIFLEYIGA